MNPIEFNNVWKKFKKGERLNSLRDTIPHLFKKPFSLNNDNGLRKEEFWALENVNFAIQKGEVVGIIGSNGAGKSTILKLLSRIFNPSKGKIKISGRISALIEVTAGFHPELTGRENVYLNGTILGMTRKEIDSKFDQIVDFSEIEEFIDTPVKRYSSGMYSRLGFSVASQMNPDILLVDEVLSVGDNAFQAKCAKKMRELFNSGVTIILVSHNLTLIQSLCNRVILLQKGMIVKEGIPDEVISYYQNSDYKIQEEELRKEITSDTYKVKIKQDEPIDIKSISLYGSEQNAKDNFNFGEPIFVNVKFESKKRIISPVFSFMITRSDGILCCASNTKEKGFIIDSIDGRGAINISLGKINLGPGIYLIKVCIWDKDMIHSYATARKDILKIESKGLISNNAVFLPEVKWKVE
jgi:lipopolysaccharide transport system ATP-binding protein